MKGNPVRDFGPPDCRDQRPLRKCDHLYRHPAGGLIRVFRDGSVRLYPAWCHQASVVIPRARAAHEIRAARRAGKIAVSHAQGRG